jgi:hypothetical protein
MKRIILTALVALLSAGFTLAHAGPQQEKMKTCNAEAKGKKGDERKAFMKVCLSAKKEAPAPAAAPAPVEKKAAQQDKMKSCNKEAGDKKLKGDERKKFMSGCLKG